MNLSGQNAVIINSSYLNIPLSEVIKDFEKEHNLLFAYNINEIEGIYVHSYFENTNVEEAIKKILLGSGMEFHLINENEFLIRKDKSYLNKGLPFFVTGQILSKEENNPLGWATIYDEETKSTTYSNDKGEFKLRLISDQKEGILKVSYLGYKNISLNWTRGKNDFNIQMEIAPINLTTIEVIDKMPILKSQINYDRHRGSFSINKIHLGSPGVADELASLKFLAGVNATNGMSAGLRLRGGDESESLYLLDGVEYYNVGHFFGVFSAFEPLIIDSTSLYLTDFPIEYGGRTSGLVKMKVKNPVPGKFSGILDFHSLYLHAQLNIPLTKSAAILVSTRFTNGNISESDIFDVILQNNKSIREIEASSENELLLSTVPDFRFNDTQIKWMWSPNSKTSFSLSILSGEDKYLASYDRFQEKILLIDTITLNHKFNENWTWRNQGFNFSMDQEVNDHWTTHVDLSASSQISNKRLDASYLKLKFRPVRIDTTRVTNLTINEVAGAKLQWNNYLKLKNGHEITAGIDIENHRSRLGLNLIQRDVDRRDTSININMFVSGKIKLNPKFDLKIGLRSSYYNLIDKYFLSPRISLQYKPSAYMKLGGSIGAYNQFLRSIVYEDRFGQSHDIWLLANDSIPVLKSFHQNIHIEYKKDGFYSKLEFFRKSSLDELEQMYVLRDFDPDNNKPTTGKLEIFSGKGLSYGFDLSTSYLHSRFAVSLAYSYSINTIRIKQIDKGNPFPSSNDRRHEIDFLVETYLGKWTIGASAVYGSGLPYVSALTVKGRDRRGLTADETITRLPEYIRVDAAVAFDFSLLKQQMSAGLSIYNLSDRANISHIQYLYNVRVEDPDTGIIENTTVGNEIQLLPRTMDIFLRWNF